MWWWCALGAQWVMADARLPGGAPAALAVDGERFVAPRGGEVVDFDGGYVVPAVIDSHVHLTYYPVGAELRASGVVAAVDLAAPRSALGRDPRLRSSGPMITAVGGYPTQSWGAGGYGWPVRSAAEARTAVDALLDGGAALIKLPFEPPWLPDAALAAAVDGAHRREAPVVCHALDEAGAAKAAASGCDVLAHAPVQRLTDATVAAWGGRTVISTLAAFGGRDAAVENLARLRAAGATVLYGTDLGNTRTVGISADEIALLGRAGLDPAAILASMTTAPAQRWGWAELGRLAPGAEASFLVLDADPLVDPAAVARPRQVWIAGARVR